MTSSVDVQLKPTPVAAIPTGSVYQAGMIQGQNSQAQQMALIGNKNGGKFKQRKRSKRKRSRKKHSTKRHSTKRKRKRGGAITPQTFPPTYPQPSGGVTPNESSAAITKLFANSAANSEYDGLVGTTTNKGGRRTSKRYSKKKRVKSCLKSKKRKKRKGGNHIRWGCMS